MAKKVNGVVHNMYNNATDSGGYAIPPLETNLALGQLVVNTSESDPCVLFKTSSGKIVKIVSEEVITKALTDILGNSAADLDTLRELIAQFEGSANDILPMLVALQDRVTAAETALGNKANSSVVNAHINNTSNPHWVTASQVGLGNVRNVEQLGKNEKAADSSLLNGYNDYYNARNSNKSDVDWTCAQLNVSRGIHGSRNQQIINQGANDNIFINHPLGGATFIEGKDYNNSFVKDSGGKIWNAGNSNRGDVDWITKNIEFKTLSSGNEIRYQNLGTFNLAGKQKIEINATGSFDVIVVGSYQEVNGSGRIVKSFSEHSKNSIAKVKYCDNDTNNCIYISDLENGKVSVYCLSAGSNLYSIQIVQYAAHSVVKPSDFTISEILPYTETITSRNSNESYYGANNANKQTIDWAANVMTANSFVGANLALSGNALIQNNKVWHAGNSNKTDVIWSASKYYIPSNGSLNAITSNNDVIHLLGYYVADNRLAIGSSDGGASKLDLINFEINGSERARFDANGNFGVGTNNPTDRAHVVGNIRATEKGIFGGNVESNGAGLFVGDVVAKKSGAVVFAANDQAAGSATRLNDLQDVKLPANLTAKMIMAYDPAQVNSDGTTGGYTFMPAVGVGTGKVVADDIESLPDLNLIGSTYVAASDKRLKDNIRPLVGATNILLNFAAKEYEWNEEGKRLGLTDPRAYGLIAQEAATLKDIVDIVRPMHNSDYLGVDYVKIVPILIAGFQEQNKEIGAVNRKIEAIRLRANKAFGMEDANAKKIASLEAEVIELKRLMSN